MGLGVLNPPKTEVSPKTRLSPCI